MSDAHVYYLVAQGEFYFAIINAMNAGQLYMLPYIARKAGLYTRDVWYVAYSEVRRRYKEDQLSGLIYEPAFPRPALPGQF